MATQKRIVIIGAGYGGFSCCVELAKLLKPSDKTEVIILEKSKYMYHTLATPRSYVDADFDKKLFVPYDSAIPQHAAKYVRMIRGVATKILPRSVSYRAISDKDDQAVETEETLTFDYLIIATGSTYTVPIKQDPDDYSRAGTEAKLREVRSHIERAESILVIGGGFVGCEVAGDIASKYPNKSVTILESKPKLVGGDKVSEKFRERLAQSLAQLKVKVITGERLTERLVGNSFEKRVVKTTKGTEIASDIQLLCGGYRAVTELVEQMDALMITERGEIDVNPQLQLNNDSYRHMFVIGDASNHKTSKSAMGANRQGVFLAGEIVSVLRQRQTGFPNEFVPPEIDNMLLSLGPDHGVSHLAFWGGIVMGDFFTRMLKSRDMLSTKVWGLFNAQMPSA